MIREVTYSSHDEWLKLRKNGIGGSDAGAILGLSQYASPYSVWAEKTGRTAGNEESLTMEVGSYLEEFVAKKFTERTGKKVRKKNRILINSDYPFAHANVDRLIVGEKALLECKTTNSFPTMRRIRDKEYPEIWYCQMTHYLAVTGLEKAYLAVLINCRDFEVFELERDQAEIDALMEAERDFWEHVKNDEPPALDGAEATADTLSVIYADSNNGQVELFGRETLLDGYSELKKQKAELDLKITEIENIIKGDLRDNERGTCGKYSVSWQPQTRRTFQAKQYAKEHPNADLSKYYKETHSRIFKVAEI